LDKKSKGILSGLLLLIVGLVMTIYSGLNMTVQLENGYFWMFCLGVFLTIGGVIMVISALVSENDDYISEPEEKLIDHSVDDLPTITPYKKK
jgi:uncharacterized membrane protein HdeD (DUF308 family)